MNTTTKILVSMWAVALVVVAMAAVIAASELLLGVFGVMFACSLVAIALAAIWSDR